MRVKLANDRAITTDISAEVDSPGEAVPITLKKISNNVVEASIMPQHEGIHTVSKKIKIRNMKASIPLVKNSYKKHEGIHSVI